MSRGERRLCEWPTDCKLTATHAVRFLDYDSGRWSRERWFCPLHFKMYEPEELKVEEEIAA